MTPRWPPISSASSGKARPEKSIRLLLVVWRMALIGSLPLAGRGTWPTGTRAGPSPWSVGLRRAACILGGRRGFGGRRPRSAAAHPACHIALMAPGDGHGPRRDLLGDDGT